MIVRYQRPSAEPGFDFKRSDVVICSPFLYTGGIRASGAGPDAASQITEILKTIDDLLSTFGTSKSNIINAEIVLCDMEEFAAMNAVWNLWVDHDNPPGRACVSAQLCEEGARVQISVIAVVDSSESALPERANV